MQVTKPTRSCRQFVSKVSGEWLSLGSNTWSVRTDNLVSSFRMWRRGNIGSHYGSLFSTPRVRADLLPRPYCTLTKVRSTNHDCGETKPLTFGLIARGLRSWTI